MRKEVDNILEDLQNMHKNIKEMEDKIFNFLNKEINIDCNIIVKIHFGEDETNISMSIIYFNREIAYYIFGLSSNNLVRYRSNLSNINSNGDRKDVTIFIDKFESEMHTLYNCALEYNDFSYKK